jgi:hypothetical protein
MKSRIFLIFIVLILTVSACSYQEHYSELPHVAFKQLILKDTIDALDNPVKHATLVFRLTDGDGNIGLTDSDTVAPYLSNCYLTQFEYIDGQAVEVELAAPYNFRIPYVKPQGQNKLLEADILIDLDFSSYSGHYLYDSILFDFYVYDRSLNQSNIGVSPAFQLDTVGYFPEILPTE